MKRYEYKEVTIRENLITALNYWGLDGWQAIKINGWYSPVNVILMREKQDETPI